VKAGRCGGRQVKMPQDMAGAVMRRLRGVLFRRGPRGGAARAGAARCGTGIQRVVCCWQARAKIYGDGEHGAVSLLRGGGC